ncbi:hypothetical protein DFA_00330 [Cavenderia fasciculata]|uniref:SHSP domain-containing protein n=1 Tax=Cavenderia fasciculata TaxID=261658 RepID=F4PR58_CACFS|nr:uncharacterized protein DFA_00330 [Cavenderia fasciculata]EGG20469.1 hypothetical protein DFA_00330 [Cavenderia fasciculata]|eukprot:XP_004358319.1 hypothetical protein DFA_00330 [Cavenderia fasciculata]
MISSKLIRISPIIKNNNILERSCHPGGWFSRCFSRGHQNVGQEGSAFYYGSFNNNVDQTNPSSSSTRVELFHLNKHEFKDHLKNWIRQAKYDYKDLNHHHHHNHGGSFNWYNFLNQYQQKLSQNTASDKQFTIPNSKISDLSTHYLVKVEIPGVKKTDISLNFSKEGTIVLETKNNNNNLQETDQNNSNNDNQNYRKEICFEETVNCEKITAKLEDGILYITVPKEVNTNINIQ